MTELLTIVTWLRPGLVLVAGLLIAAAISLHVLRTKAEVRVAAGWIGLAWFSPFLAGAAYLLLGINRVQRRARRMRRGAKPSAPGTPSLPPSPVEPSPLEPLRRGISAITGRPIAPGNAIRILRNGDAAYPAMLAAIAQAARSIALSTYIMRDDAIGKIFVDALRQAQARGVSVRVIVDGVGSGWIISSAYQHLRRAGVPAERFMHSAMPWHMPFLNLRTHKKILVVDGLEAFTGGINIADQNILADHPAHPVQDMHFHLRGPVVAQLVEAFAQDWSFVNGERLHGPAWFPPLAPAGPAAARVVTAGPDEDLENIEFAVMQAIACARRSICVMTPYFLPDQSVMIALALAAMRGVDVEVIVPERSDNRLVDWATRENVAPFLQAGGRIWLSPKPFCHSKLMVVDGDWSLIGSSNWDMRSFRLNFELCVEVYDRDLADALAALMEPGRGHALTARHLRARTLPARLRDATVRLFLPYL
jgi:cardiolipin synthase